MGVGTVANMYAADKAAGAQTEAAHAAMASQEAQSAAALKVQKEMYDQNRADLAPYRDAGGRALTGMEDPNFQRDFTMADFQADPGYQFRMDEGQKALERSAAARGGLMGGATLKGITNYGQNAASAEYQNSYNRFNADADRRFGRLSNIAGMGQASAAQSANSAMAYGQNAAGVYTNLGNAQAQGEYGIGNAQAASYMAQGKAVGDWDAQNKQMIGQAAGSMGAMFSDERLKENIEPVSTADLIEMRASLKAYRFNYKNEQHGKGDYVGVLAQDLEKSKLGRTLVFENQHCEKQIDIGRVMMLFLATQAEA